ncbi:hypothetical protein PCANB_000708 [Pneumocystis canis]|nr:hypothetical protein PCANB_000708 [Pneumocystis canis]
MADTLPVSPNDNTLSSHKALYTSLSIDEVIRVIDNAIQIGLEKEPLPNMLDSLSNCLVSPLKKTSTQPPTYSPPSPPLSTQHSVSTSISNIPSENSSSISSSMALTNLLNYWLNTEKTYIIELSIFQELLLRGTLVTQINESSLETISRCISIFITASSSIINTFEMYIPAHLLHKTLMSTLPMFTDTVSSSFESYISTYILTLDDQYLSPENHKWLTVALYNCGILQSTGSKKCQWLLSSPLHRIKMYTRIFHKFLRVLAGHDDELSKQFSYAHQCFHLLLSKARGHIKMIKERMGKMPPASNDSGICNLTNNVHNIEKNIDVSKTKDLFTFEEKKYVLNLQPPQLPFVRSVIARSNFLLKMVHSVTKESIQKRVELVLITDIILFLDIETPKTKYLMFQPFLSRIFKVIETDEERTFILSFYEREHIYLTASTKRAKKLWVNMLSSSRAIQNVNYSVFKFSPINNPITPKNTHNSSTILNETRPHLPSDSTSFKKILLRPQPSKLQNSQDKSLTKQLSTIPKNDLPIPENIESKNNSLDNGNGQSILINQSHPSTSHNIITAYRNKSEPIPPGPTDHMQKFISKPMFNPSALGIHCFPQPPDRTSNGLFPFSDKNSRPNNYSCSYIMPRMSKIRLETLPEENESFIESLKSPDINNSDNDKNYEEKESSEDSLCPVKSENDSISKSEDDSTSKTASISPVNEHNHSLPPEPSNPNANSEENEFQQSSPSSHDSITQSLITDSNTSVFSKSTSQTSEKIKTESDTTESIEDQALLLNTNIDISQAFATPQLPMPDLGRASLTSMVFNDSILGLSYSDSSIAKTSETSNEDNNPNNTEILFRNSKLIEQLPPSLSSEYSEILFCEKANVFFWNCTFWKNIFDLEKKVFLIIKYTCKTDAFTLEIYNLSSHEVVVCGELQKYSTIVRQAKQEISIACFIQNQISYILSRFENDSNADLFYIILYRIINRDNPWVVQVFQNNIPANHVHNTDDCPTDTSYTFTQSPKTSNIKKIGPILNKSKARVFFQINAEQWEYLGSGILWITSLSIDSKKHILIAKKAKQNKSLTILNGIVSRSECQRSGRTGIIVKCFEELANKTAIYLIKVKNQKRATCIIDILNS